ncbi:lipoamide acyltransferase component of branched-chain alpha-keto acid dehydrogenase complex, mitochondrial [Nilaparvata lugens]|uniref:lipoamide acyltransferase component of branched-chain alpha-keto acid dehydrogenase complex, mitochondrial n=1 Tax=Nilaparvata lugens TaxID=108931 RepID=UPI000B9885F8|nr:lipoamide acyltransferase component of branched-chain alpha-keto acid dehydrogenase complex, mitochondrial [Nilaparvata lugens]
MAARIFVISCGCRHFQKRAGFYKINSEFGFRFGKQRGFRTCAADLKIVQFCLSDIGEGIREVKVKDWHVKIDDKVAQFDKICDVESDKATVEITSRYDGVITKLYHEIDDTAKVGEPLVDIEIADDVKSPISENKTPESISKSDEEPTKKIVEVSRENVEDNDDDYLKQILANKSLATPAVRRIASENKIKLNEIKATGKNNRVLKEDILAHLQKIKSPSISETSTEPCVVKPITGMTRTMVKTMTKSNDIPVFHFSDEIDVTKIVELRSRIHELIGVKFTYLPFIMKALSKGLLEYPILNTSIDDKCENIAFKSFHNIGIAVDTPNGLVVPNVKNVEKLSIQQISQNVQRLQELGKSGKLSVKDLTGGTISISNIGAIGGVSGVPLILPPEVAIISVGRIQKLPRFDENDNVIKTHMINFTWTADHRIVDGATVARCSQLIKKYLENPELIMMDL